MQKIIVFFHFCLLSATASAQSHPGPAGLSMEDLKKLSKMSPAQQEAYRQQMLKGMEENAKKLSAAYNIKLDETILPTATIAAPIKDIKRLAAIPAQPPTRQQLLLQTANMETALRKAIPTTVSKDVDSFAMNKSTKEIQQAALGGWYRDNPQAALLLGMKVVRKAPEQIVGWNNLAAMMNMAGLQQQAVPILQYCLVEKPDNAMLLNNMGQAYLGLGDLAKANQYLQRCLSIDDLHPEANRSMAMISMFGKDYEKALQYFEKEMQVAQRRSSLAQVVKSGNKSRLNLAALRKAKMQRDGTDKRNFFEEISLTQFKLPDLPMTLSEARGFMENHDGLLQSLANEMMFWSNAGSPSPEQLRAEGRRHSGIYAGMVNELIKDIGNTYSPLIALFAEEDIKHIEEMRLAYYQRMHEIVCPQAPLTPGAGADLALAYQKKCCDLKTPVIDAFMSRYNAFVQARINIVQSRWKEYINGLISIVQLDPSPGNKRLAYTVVSNYFVFLITCMQSVALEPDPIECDVKMTAVEADAIIESNHSFDFKCPDWLKIEVSLKYAKLSADCDAYNIEADVYGLISVGAEKSFKTGTSTLYVGAGIDGSWQGVAEGSISQQFYIVFDSNNQFADLGMRGNGSGELAGGLIGAEAGYDFSMNSGFNGQVEVKSGWIEQYEKVLGLVVK